MIFIWSQWTAEKMTCRAAPATCFTWVRVTFLVFITQQDSPNSCSLPYFSSLVKHAANELSLRITHAKCKPDPSLHWLTGEIRSNEINVALPAGCHGDATRRRKASAGWVNMFCMCAWYGNLPCNWSLIVLMVLAGSKLNTSK